DRAPARGPGARGALAPRQGARVCDRRVMSRASDALAFFALLALTASCVGGEPRPTGASCASGGDCASGHCISNFVAGAQWGPRCTATCATTNDCPSSVPLCDVLDADLSPWSAGSKWCLPGP